MAVQYLGDAGPDGTVLGRNSSEKISFYGGSPAARSALSTAAVETTLAISTTTTKWGFSTSTQANQVVTLLNEIRAKLVSLGLTA